MLRPRSKTVDTNEWWAPDLNGQGNLATAEDSFWSLKMGKRPNQQGCASRLRIRFTRTRLCIFLLIGIIFVIFGAYMRSKYMAFTRASIPGPEIESQLAANTSDGSKLERMYLDLGKENDVDIKDHSTDHLLNTVPKSTWKYPLVDRAILDKLDRMQEFFAQNYGLSPPTTSRAQWPPLVTRIPERKSRPVGRGSSSSALNRERVGVNAICESVKHPRPCRFLLPLRVAEQESKARIHLSQIAELARSLNRTLVLPNVGKSKIGACFKWPMATYYDVTSLAGEEDSQEAYIDLEVFRTWWDGRERQRGGLVNSQLISMAATLPGHDYFRKEPLYVNDDVSVYAYNVFGAWERDLPGCFANKFHPLGHTLPVFMSIKAMTNKDGSIRPIGGSVLDAFGAISGRTRVNVLQPDIGNPIGHPMSPEPNVLVLNWDLRHPVFPSSFSGQPLQYSTRMHDLAEKHAPKGQYLAIHWRMETIEPESLQECAHALVDALARVLHDQALTENVTTVWFASDYPYPIARRSASQRRPAIAAKSGTFKDFEIRHEEAVEILRKAFDQQGELDGWRLTDFAESLEAGKDVEKEVLEDAGVLGIVDKLVSIKSDFFISGSTRCARKSSFTKQVVDARTEEWSRSRHSQLRNIVDVFG